MRNITCDNLEQDYNIMHRVKNSIDSEYVHVVGLQVSIGNMSWHDVALLCGELCTFDIEQDTIMMGYISMSGTITHGCQTS